MDSFEVDTVKAEKANAMKKYRRIRKITIVFRFIEVCVVLFLLSWFSARLPVAVRISGDYFRHLCVFFVSRLFVFLVGNAIIITLFVISGKFSGGNHAGNSAGSDELYGELLRSSESQKKVCTNSSPSQSPSPSPPPIYSAEEIVYEDKAVCEESIVTDTYKHTDTDTKRSAKVYRRSQSETLFPENKQEICRKTFRELRRSETEMCRSDEKFGQKPAEVTHSEADMSNEEFRRTIEAFIAKQQKFLREESMAIVLHNP